MPTTLRRIATVSLAVFGWCAASRADLDWGGGATQFRNSSGAPLTAGTGLAVLVSVRAGGLVNPATCQLGAAADLVTPGAVVAQGGSANVILAVANTFHDGYLLLTLTPDLDTATQQARGGAAGEALHLIVWDAATLVAGLPVEGSRFVALPLFADGEPQQPAATFGASLPLSAAMVYPDASLATVRCDTVRNTPAETFALTLRPGWNLISIPFALPNPSLTAVFGSLPVAVWQWDMTRFLAPDALAPKIGYWVCFQGAADTDLTVQGHRPADASLALVAGWNLVGPVVDLARPANLVAVYRWDSQAQAYVEETATLRVGHGYWIWAPGAIRVR